MARRPVAALILAASLLASCHLGSDTPRDVVLITVDTMRADHLGIYGYPRATTPNLERWFSEDGRVQMRSYSAEAATTPSVVSLLTGLVPQQHRVRQLVQLVPHDLDLLPDMLPDGWQTAGFVSNMMLTSEASGLGQHFDHYDDFVDERERYRADTFERNAARTTQAVLDWMQGEGTRKPGPAKGGATPRDKNRPLFLWVHYMDPHGPYHAPDDWKRTFRHDSPVAIIRCCTAS